MISISRSNIPKYLHHSSFYYNLDDQEGNIDIPENCYKEDETINNFEDFKRLFHVYNYFLCEFSESFVRYYIMLSRQVFNYFSIFSEEVEVRDMLVKFSEYKIENTWQFITTYKIMKLYDLVESQDFYRYYSENKHHIMSKCSENDEDNEDNEDEKNLAHEIKKFSSISISYDVHMSLYSNYCISVTEHLGFSSSTRYFDLKYHEIKTEIDKLKELRSCISDRKDTSYVYRYLTYDNRTITMDCGFDGVKINFFNRFHMCSKITVLISVLEKILHRSFW